MQIQPKPSEYGVEDASFRAAGGEAGLRQLADAFYDQMESRPDAQRILKLHPSDLEVSRDKLARFLCGWLGGPKRYAEKYGPIKLPRAHAHLPVSEEERDAWLACMQEALAAQPYAPEFRQYMMEQLYRPAERIRVVCAERASSR